MRTDELDYELPAAAIATRPIEPRDAARLLVDRGDRIEHRSVRDLPSLVGTGDVMVVNDTRVMPARVRFHRSSGGVGEVLFLGPRGDGIWEALVRPSAKLSPGTVVQVGDDFAIEIGEDHGAGLRTVRPATTEGLDAALATWGDVPLPPYLGDVRLDDPERYQTTYARRSASAAAPTAGLHLTPEVLAGVTASGALVVPVELVIGLGTFRPVTVERLDDHVMHHETYAVPESSWSAIEKAERVIAVGTTVVRALESAARTGELTGRTDLFIRPSYPWRVVGSLVTNFHLPRSSLLAMIQAFVGPRWRDLYAAALAEGYRFLSFGDASFLTRSDR